MKIFITGVAGFLGSHLADRFIELGHEVIGNDILVGGYLDNVPNAVEFHRADCCDLDGMTNLLKDVDVIVHTAATAHEGLSVFSPNFITKNIFQATVSTLSAAIKNNVNRFVYCSSMARYGDQETPFTEDMTPQPVDPYGIAKVAAENVLKSLAEVHGIEWNIAVPHNIIGPRQRYDDPFRNVMSIMINRNLQGNASFIYGDGMQTRCFSPIQDCVNCLEKLSLDKNITEEIVNIGPDRSDITIKELANIISIKTDCNLEPVYMPSRPKEVKHAICSSEKARKLLDYQESTKLEESIQDTIKFIQQRGPKSFDYNIPIEIYNSKTPKTWGDKLI